MITNKYKYSNLAKDLNMKNKDLFTFLSRIGLEGKQHSTVVEPDEYNYIMSCLTKEKQITNLDSYMEGKATITAVPEAEKAAEHKASETVGKAADEAAVPTVSDPAPKAEPAVVKEPEAPAAEAPKAANEEKKQSGNRAQPSRLDRFQNRPDFSQKQSKRDDKR